MSNELCDIKKTTESINLILCSKEESKEKLNNKTIREVTNILFRKKKKQTSKKIFI